MTGKVLGKGSYGLVTICIERETGEELACKTIHKTGITSK